MGFVLLSFVLVGISFSILVPQLTYSKLFGFGITLTSSAETTPSSFFLLVTLTLISCFPVLKVCLSVMSMVPFAEFSVMNF